ncbi:J domain-containing protein [Ancylothrix sp. C2]|uniref:J domain-containing protein n=1 Tax=Ancylothrix sp. D3o TaxID=2953691 RepID=UPI0021BA62E6|nr:J domain-containing protein [Ancylothrix sp. D3o]MCT7952230.1 J domain-containing protein [Ancylothrix sp. D3o]
MENKQCSANPYDILGVSPAASKAEITKAMGLAMKRKEYPLQEIAAAQKSLLDSQKRIIADYLRPILPPIKRFKRTDFSSIQTTAPQLNLLADFEAPDLDIERKVVNYIRNDINPNLPSHFAEIDTKLEAGAQLPSQEELSVKFIGASLSKLPKVIPQAEINPELKFNGSHLVLDGIRFFAWLFVFGQIFSTVVLAFNTGHELQKEQEQAQNIEYLTSSESPEVPQRQQITQLSETPAFVRQEKQRSPRTEPVVKPEFSELYYAKGFPQNTCGDQVPSGTNEWYPVYVNYSEDNLNRVRNFYCRDAFKKQRQTGEISVQVASFLNRSDAVEFANILKFDLDSGEVGKSSSYNFDAPSVRANAADLLRNKSNSFPLSSCGDSHPGRINVWYPVNVNYSVSNLRFMQKNYCADAFVKYVRETNTDMIQVASFLNINDAREFANFLKTQVGSGELGESSIY